MAMMRPWLPLMLLLVSWRDSMYCSGINVDPPEEIVISDLGLLGRLQITWSPPTSLMNMTECSQLRYQLEYFNTYEDTWTPIRMSGRTYIAQFDLMKDVRVRVYTLLSGPCTNNTMIKSTNYTELVQKPPSTGFEDTAVQDFVCVYYNMKNLECKWRGSPKTLANSQQYLYFWHKKLGKAEECPKYIISSGTRSGCNFTGKPLPEFTAINFCVNGSSPVGPLKPTFISLQIQNHVKPETVKQLHLETGPDTQLTLRWNSPAGRVPGHCLEWEVEHYQDGSDGKIILEWISTKEMSISLPYILDNNRKCFRVRSKLSKYCADKSFWSEWSNSACNSEVTPEPEWSTVHVYVYIAIAIISTLTLSLCVAAALTVRRLKRPDSLLTTLLARNSPLTVVKV